MDAFIEDDRVTVKPSEKIRLDLHNMSGVILKWHHDNTYTVKLDNGMTVALDGSELAHRA